MNKNTLTIAFYIAKHNIESHPQKQVLENLVSKELNIKSFKNVIQEIRVSLYGSDKTSLNLSQNALNAISDNSNKTIAQLRRDINKIIEDHGK